MEDKELKKMGLLARQGISRDKKKKSSYTVTKRKLKLMSLMMDEEVKSIATKNATKMGLSLSAYIRFIITVFDDIDDTAENININSIIESGLT